jgi:putative membrane protein
MRKFAFVQYFNWRVLLLRVLVNAIALLITAAIVPHIYFVDRHFLTLLWMALVLGILNGLVKPIVQFLTLPFIFATSGVVIVLINAGLLWFLSVLFPSLFAVNGFAWALLGGLVMGLLGSFLESALGVTPPIVPEKYGSLRQQIGTQSHAVQTMLARSASSSQTSGAPAAAPSPLEPPAASIEDGSEPVAPNEMAPAAPVALQVEGVDSASAEPGESPVGPVADGMESEG